MFRHVLAMQPSNGQYESDWIVLGAFALIFTCFIIVGMGNHCPASVFVTPATYKMAEALWHHLCEEIAMILKASSFSDESCRKSKRRFPDS